MNDRLAQSATTVPIGRIIRLVAKAIRLGKGGYTRGELRELAADLLDLGGTVLALSEAARAS
ncbi:MAG: hypothetical protein GY872_20970 [Roseibacillus sp.]|nr:hypothetical protein [Roseibacillus sp.]